MKPPTPSPELSAAKENLRAAEKALNLATLKQWEAGGLPWKFRLDLLFYSVWAILLPAFVLLVVFSQLKGYLTMQALTSIRSGMRHPDYISPLLFSLPVVLLCLFFLRGVIKRLRFVHGQTEGFPKSRRSLNGTFLLGGVLGTLLGVRLSLWMMLPF